MHFLGRPTVGQLLQYLKNNEQDTYRRGRLFASIGSPRSIVINELSSMVMKFVSDEWCSLNDSLLLDYGCGVMPYIKAFELSGAKIVGVDIGKNEYANLRVGDKDFLPFSNDSFDYLLGIQVLEHIPIPDFYLSEAYRVLKRGGKMFLTTHGVWPYHPTPIDYHRWTKQGLIFELENSGFIIKSIHHILNDYSASIQNLVTIMYYRGSLKAFNRQVHSIAYLLIKISEKLVKHEPQTPAVLCFISIK